MTEGAAEVVREISIRMAGAADVPLLAELNEQLIRDERHRNSMSLDELQQRMSEFLIGDYEAVLFETGGEVVGYALFRPESEHLYVRQFFVRPEFRRRGLGRLAMTRLKQLAWRRHSRIRLDVLVTNIAALEFWRSVGFSDYCITLEFEREDEPSHPTAEAPAPPSD